MITSFQKSYTQLLSNRVGQLVISEGLGQACQATRQVSSVGV